MTAAALSHTQERKANTSNGGLMLLLTLVVMGLMVWAFISVIRYEEPSYVIALIALSIVLTAQLIGFYSLQPNEAAAITLFGNYKGTDRTPGLRWVLPWYTKK